MFLEEAQGPQEYQILSLRQGKNRITNPHTTSTSYPRKGISAKAYMPKVLVCNQWEGTEL